MTVTRFVQNYNDQSTDAGFQFEFFCDRCGSGYQTEFTSHGLGPLPDILEAAGSLFGGIVGAVADMHERARSAGWEKAHDEAFKQAVQEIQAYFHQCNRCSAWVDATCWEQATGQCNDCRETRDEESIEETNKPAKKTKNKPQSHTRHCDSCQTAVTANAKFCPNCGNDLNKSRLCPECSAEVTGKFCSDCGHAL